MIPKNITKHDVLRSIEYIDMNEVPENRKSTKYYLKYNEKYYPPKYIISIANKKANRKELKASKFNGGKEANTFLESLGFEIVKKCDIHNTFPLKCFSWTILSDRVFIKEMDRSTFLHNGSGIPKDVKKYFNIEKMKKGERKEVKLIYGKKNYDAIIEMDTQPNPRSRIIWKSDFANLIKHKLSDWFYIYSHSKDTGDDVSKMRFEKDSYDSSIFKVEFINPLEIKKNSLKDYSLEKLRKIAKGKSREGIDKVERKYGVYIRSQAVKEYALKRANGICENCNSNAPFIKTDETPFLEVHHIKRVSDGGPDDPEWVAAVYPNCHRELHYGAGKKEKNKQLLVNIKKKEDNLNKR